MSQCTAGLVKTAPLHRREAGPWIGFLAARLGACSLRWRWPVVALRSALRQSARRTERAIYRRLPIGKTLISLHPHGKVRGNLSPLDRYRERWDLLR
jgi:hypothetical protein